MTEAREAFLTDAGWAGAKSTPVAGDLSARRYTRLTASTGSAILMECAPEDDTSLRAFLKMTHWLRAQNLSAPEIYASSTTAGLALLEDFGDAKLTTLIARDASVQLPFYETLLDALVTVRDAPPPDLETPSARALCEATLLADDWYPGANSEALSAFRAGLETVLKRILQTPATVSLRDFHADNIIWLPSRKGAQKAGLLDYQDAFLTHPAYDLMSLLTDARTDVSPTLQKHMIEAYAARTGDSVEALTEAVAILGAQRNLRILGIFARAARRDRKPHHLPSMPRVYGHLISCCAHPSLAPFSGNIADALPAPDAALLKGLSA